MFLNDIILIKRSLWTIFIVIVFLLIFSAFRYFTGTREAEGQAISDPQLYRDIPFDDILIRLDRRALDEAYHAQLMKLWGVWLSQQAGDPGPFTNGLKIARKAYHQAAGQIAKREQQIHEREQQLGDQPK